MQIMCAVTLESEMRSENKAIVVIIFEITALWGSLISRRGGECHKPEGFSGARRCVHNRDTVASAHSFQREGKSGQTC